MTFPACPGGGNFNLQGGAIFADTNVQITIRDTTFESNMAANQGGAIYAGSNVELKIFSSTFTANTAGAAVSPFAELIPDVL